MAMSDPEAGAAGEPLTFAPEELTRYQPDEAYRIRAAVELAAAAHDGQLRASGEPYLVHPINVGRILIDTQMDADAVCAGLLHDAIEDTGVSEEELRERFGSVVAELVQGVTKISQLRGQSRTVQKAETIRKILLAMARDVRVIIIKLADKLHNMRTLQFLDPERQKRIAEECLEIYSPLAGRLGMYRIKSQLEDEALRVLQPAVYEQLRQFVTQRRDDRHEYLLRLRDLLLERAAESGLDLEVQSRIKHFYSIYRKQRDRGKAIDEIHDLFGIRVLCADDGQCYEVLGLIHSLWPPMEGRFKDYIAMPKSNRYQSLHTTVMGPRGTTIEIQIRSDQMHETAENGIAAHWLYKSRRSGDTAAPAGELSIINKLRDWQGAQAASTEFLDEIKRELLRDSIYVFTPKGDIIELPRGSTPIDFAYHIHTEVGNHCMAAKANGSIVPLAAELKNTQVIQVITNTRARPHVGWLRTVKTTRARQKIRHWLTQENPDLIIQRNIVAKPARPAAPRPARPEVRPEADARPDVDDAAWRVGLREGNDAGLLIRLARCCRPSPADEIVGYVSRGQGITVHRASCANVRNARDFNERGVEVAWEVAWEMPTPLENYSFIVTAEPDARLYSEIEKIIHNDGGTLVSGHLDPDSQAHLTGRFTVAVKSRRDYGRVIKHLKSLAAVQSLHRESGP
jgi:GTP pyrophosphokinase